MECLVLIKLPNCLKEISLASHVDKNQIEAKVAPQGIGCCIQIGQALFEGKIDKSKRACLKMCHKATQLMTLMFIVSSM